MIDDEPFLRMMLANPGDHVSRLVYADWLDDRADPRGEYARLAARVAELTHGHPDRSEPRRRMLEIQPRLPSWWVAITGGLRAVAASRVRCEPRITEAAQILGREPRAIDEEGYHAQMEAAAVSGLTQAVAYFEVRGLGGWDCVSNYRLTLCDAERKVTYEPYLHSLYRGCSPRFLEWFGDAVLFVYREKHRTYAVHLGFEGPARSHVLADNWILEDRELAYRRREQPEVVQRVSVPDLTELSPLTAAEAAARELLPKLEWL